MSHSVLASDLSTHEEVVAQAHALQPVLRQHAAAGESLRRLPDPVNAALAEAGMFRLRTPKRFGGHAVGVGTVLEVSEALAEGMTVIDYAPNSPVAEDILNLVTWLRNTSVAVQGGHRGMRWSER